MNLQWLPHTSMVAGGGPEILALLLTRNSDRLLHASELIVEALRLLLLSSVRLAKPKFPSRAMQPF